MPLLLPSASWHLVSLGHLHVHRTKALSQFPHLPPLLFTAFASLSRSTQQPAIQIQAPQSCPPPGPPRAQDLQRQSWLPPPLLY